MEDGIEQHRSMLLNNIEKTEKTEKYMFLYSPSSETTLNHFVTYDFKEAFEFCIKNKCKIEIFYLELMRWEYVSSNAFITPPQ